MGNKFRKIKNLINNIWADSPWIRASGILASTAAGLIFLNIALPTELSIDLSKIDKEVNQIIIIFVIVLYFFLVSVFSGDRLRFEKRLRALEQSFRYDNRGTLYNGKEPNIAFRVTTFKGILEGVSDAIGADNLVNVLTDIGRASGEDFAHSLKEIYNSNVAIKKAKSCWAELSFGEKLNQWAEYDSATGWGIVTCDVNGNEVKVIINHLHELLDGNGGLMFGYFLGGYIETIISYTISEHKGGKFEEYSQAKLLEVDQIDKYTIEVQCQLS